MSEKKNEKLTLDQVTENLKIEFGRAARSYVVTLFGTAQRSQQFTDLPLILLGDWGRLI